MVLHVPRRDLVRLRPDAAALWALLERPASVADLAEELVAIEPSFSGDAQARLLTAVGTLVDAGVLQVEGR